MCGIEKVFEYAQSENVLVKEVVQGTVRHCLLRIRNLVESVCV